ncbi:MAG: glycosylhydrolase-like jelly roll fold domain-containing protein [Gemmatimonadaceae bacterium]
MAPPLDVARFADPPAEDRPALLWFWNGTITNSLIDRQLAQMRRVGVRTFVLFPFESARLVPAVFSEGWFDRVGYALRVAQRTGMRVWLFNDAYFPSGKAAGLVVRGGRVGARRYEPHPELAPRAVYRMVERVTGGSVIDPRARRPKLDPPDQTLPAFVPRDSAAAVIAVIAAPVRGDSARVESALDLTAIFQRGGSWSAPQGEWELQWYGSYRVPGFGGDGYVDLMSDEAARRFIDAVPAEYLRRFPWAIGSVLRGFWDDEPILTSWWGLRPWSDALPSALRALGSSPAQTLPALFDDGGRAGRIARGIYWRAIANRFAAGWYRTQGEWARAHGVEMISNPQNDDVSVGRVVKAEGEPAKSHQWFQRPGADVVFRQFLPGDHTLLPRYATSAGHIAGRPRILAEFFGAYGWGLTPREARFVIGAFASRGVNDVVLHAFWSDSSAVVYPPPFDPSNPWWDAMPEFVRWIGRVTDLGRGVPGDAVALLQPQRAAEAWQDTPERYQLDSGFMRTAIWLEAQQQEFDLLSESMLDGDSEMTTRARVLGDSLQVGSRRYHSIVLPPARTMSLETARLLVELARAGGEVVARSPLPTEETRGRDDSLRVVLSQLGGMTSARISAAARLARPAPDLRVRRTIRGADVLYLIMNESGTAVPAELTVPERGLAHIWNPDLGSRSEAATRPAGQGTEVRLRLEPFQLIGLSLTPAGSVREHWCAAETDPPPDHLIALDSGWDIRFGDRAGWQPIALSPSGWSSLDSTYSGVASYRRSLLLARAQWRSHRRWVLDLGEVHEVAAVEVNGHRVGRVLWPPYALDITSSVRPGANRIVVRVTNTLANRHRMSLSSGLSGPVSLRRVYDSSRCIR